MGVANAHLCALTLLLLGARSLADKVYSCPFEPTWCGGGSGGTYCGQPVDYPGCEIACSPWPLKRKGWESSQPSWCNYEGVRNFAGEQGLAQAWFDPTQPDTETKNYWVFHGCDGAGIMMGDCLGEDRNIEQWGPLSFPVPQLPLPPPPDCSTTTDPMCFHRRPTAWQHPGTKRLYSWMNLGMWIWGGENIQWPDQAANKPWWSQMGIPNIEALGPQPYGYTAFAVMYPWTCNYKPGEDWSFFWSGDLAPWGDNTRHVQCYGDNEPYDVRDPGSHWFSKQVPPTWTAYKFWKYSDDELWGWVIAQKTGAAGEVLVADPETLGALAGAGSRASNATGTWGDESGLEEEGLELWDAVPDFKLKRWDQPPW